MTFAGRPEDLDRLAGATFGVTAPDELRPVAESLVVEMGGEPVWVPESARPIYHAALTDRRPTTSSRWSTTRSRCWTAPGSPSPRGCSRRC